MAKRRNRPAVSNSSSEPLVVHKRDLPRPVLKDFITDQSEWDNNPDAALDRLFAAPVWPPLGWEGNQVPRTSDADCINAWFDTVIMAATLTGNSGRIHDAPAIRDAQRLLNQLAPGHSWQSPEDQLTALHEATELGMARQILMDRLAPPPKSPQRKRRRAEKPPELPELASPQWSKPNGLAQWAKVFGCSRDTLKRRFAADTIRHKKLSPKSYQIAINDLPAQEQDKHRQSK